MNEEIIIELEDMTEEQQAIVAAGNVIAGSFPTGLSRDELRDWIRKRFSAHPTDDADSVSIP